MNHRIAHRTAAAWLACLATLSCRSATPPGANATGAVAATRPVLRAAPVAEFSATEQRMIETVGSFYASLLTALRDPALATGDVDTCAARLAASLDPVLGDARALATPHAALPGERRLAIHQEAFRRYPAEVRALLEAAGRWTGRFRSPDEQPKFRRITEKALGPWARDGALWVAGGFGPDAVEELREWASGREEKDEERS